MPVGSVDQRRKERRQGVPGHRAETRRLAAESEELLKQSFVLANPQTQAFRDYLDRLYLHTTKLAALIVEVPYSPDASE